MPGWCSPGNVDREILLTPGQAMTVDLYRLSSEQQPVKAMSQVVEDRVQVGLTETWSFWKTHGQDNLKRETLDFLPIYREA